MTISLVRLRTGIGWREDEVNRSVQQRRKNSGNCGRSLRDRDASRGKHDQEKNQVPQRNKKDRKSMEGKPKSDAWLCNFCNEREFRSWADSRPRLSNKRIYPNITLL